MAVTPLPLVWDHYKETGQSGFLGGLIHFYDENAQRLWNLEGLNTQLTEVPLGNWEQTIWGNAQKISDDRYIDMDLDHPYNGVVFGVGVTEGGQLVYLRYIYAMDCTYLISSGTVEYSNDSPSVQVRANLMNAGEGIFMDDATLFQPGAKMTLGFVVGEESPYPMCVAYVDSADYNIKSTTVPITGRNSVGFKLMQSTFDDVTETTGPAHMVVGQIMQLGEVDNCIVEENADERTHEFRADQTLMDGLEQVCELYPRWKVVELPDGTVVVGSQDFINQYQSNGYYVFSLYRTGNNGSITLDRSLLKRKSKRSSDASYTKVRVTGRDAEDNELQPVTVPVGNYTHWNLPKNKTYHETAPDGLTQEELQTYAEDVAVHLQYTGFGEDFTTSLQPHLLIGDIASFDNGDGTITPLGVVTSIKHAFGKSGFSTDFSTDSGGILISSVDALYTKIKPLNGYNRKQTIKDLIQIASGSSKAGPRSTGTVVRVVASKNAETLGGKTYQQLLEEATKEVLEQIKESQEGTT